MKCKNLGISGSIDFRPFQLIRPWFACKARSTPDPKMIQSKGMFNPQFLGTFNGYLRLWRGVVGPRCKNQGIPGSIDFRPFQLICPWFACEARSTPDPKMIKSKAKYNPWLSGTLTGCLQLCRGVARLEVHKSRHSGINRFPAISADSSLVRVQDKIKT